MLKVARQLAAEARVSNVSFIEGDAQVHPLTPASFDAVISSFGVMFFDDPAAAFANIVKALRQAAGSPSFAGKEICKTKSLGSRFARS